jgi:hypothetical protein
MKPDWLKKKESEIPRAYKKCVDCKNKGDVCGRTNYAGPGRGRLPMYRCKRHPWIEFHEETLACEDYE